MRRFWSIICCFFLFISFISMHGSKASAEIMEIVAEGSYVAGDGPDENFAIAKDRARLEAKRNAAEQAGVYIESYSEINNMRLTKDEIHTITANVLRIKSEEFNISTQDNKYIVFTCRIVCDVDTENIEFKHLKKVNDLQTEISELRKELSMLQKLIGDTESKKKTEYLLNNERKDNIIPKDNHEKQNIEKDNVIIPKDNYEKPITEKNNVVLSKDNHEERDIEKIDNFLPKDNNKDNTVYESMEKSSNNREFKDEVNSAIVQSPKYNVPEIEHDGERLVVSFSNKSRMAKESDFVKRPKGYKNPTPQSEMHSTGLIPNPQKWEFMLYSSKLPHNQPVWYDPTSIKIIKNGDTLKVLCDIMSYRAFYSNSDRWVHNIYQKYTVMVDYTDSYYVLLNKQFYEEGEKFSPGFNRTGSNYDDVDVQISFVLGKNKKISFPEFLADICAEALK